MSDGISENGESIVMNFANPEKISELRLTFYSDFNYPIRITMSPNRQKQQRAGVPAELIKDYTINLKKNGTTVKTIEVKNNHQRLNVLHFEETLCDCVEVLVQSTNGATDAAIFEIRAYE